MASESGDAVSDGRSRRREEVAPPPTLCESRAVGPRTRVWPLARVLPGARIGADCNVCDSRFIEDDVVVGDRVTVKCGVQLWDGVRSRTTSSSAQRDLLERSRSAQPAATDAFLRTVVKAGASIGADATILPGVTIGQGTMVGAGAVIVETVPPYAVVAGNPAHIVGYVASRARRGSIDRLAPRTAAAQAAEVAGRDRPSPDVRPRMPTARQSRRRRGDAPSSCRSRSERFFVVHDVSTGRSAASMRIGSCHQFLVCLRGG